MATLPGPKQNITLVEVTETQAVDGKLSETEIDVVTFRGVFAPLSATERLQLDKQTETSTHRVMVAHSTMGATNAAKLIASNKLEIDSISYDITGVFDYNAGKIQHHYEIYLKRVK